MELTRALEKTIRSLAGAKGRRREGAFVAEGTKCVLDTLDAFEVRMILATREWFDNHPLPEAAAAVAVECGRGRLGEITAMTLAPDVIAVYSLPADAEFDPEALRGHITVALDRVQDPGNLGTILRTCDWMGVTTVLASADTVDCFNPKTVQATMGAISRVRVVYGNLAEMLAKSPVDVWGTYLDGTDIYRAALPAEGVVVMGNEGSGISPEVTAAVTRRLYIPPAPGTCPASESLNVATATAIVLSQFTAARYGQGKI